MASRPGSDIVVVHSRHRLGREVAQGSTGGCRHGWAWSCTRSASPLGEAAPSLLSGHQQGDVLLSAGSFEDDVAIAAARPCGVGGGRLDWWPLAWTNWPPALGGRVEGLYGPRPMDGRHRPRTA